MDTILDFKNIFYLFAQFIGYLVGVTLIVSGLRNRKNNILLGLNFLFLTYSSFIIWLITTGYFVKFPHLYRTGYLTGITFIPLMFLYIRREIGKKPFSALDFLHLLPALVYLIDFWPTYNLPVEEKLSLIKSEISNPALFTQFSQSRFFNGDFYTHFRSFFNAVYWSFSVYWVVKGSKNKMDKRFAKEWFVWIKIFLGFQAMVFLPALLLNWAIEPITAYLLTHISVVFLNIATGLSLISFPKILYGLDTRQYENQQVVQNTTTELIKQQGLEGEQYENQQVVQNTTTELIKQQGLEAEQYENQQVVRKSKTELFDQLSEKKIAEIKTSLESVLYKEKKFLLQGYSINDLSKDTGIPSYLLTLYINNNLSTSFPDLINKERIEECCQLMASGNYGHFATEGFAKLCGFNNRNTFSLAFKKFKGTTPSSYYKNLNGGFIENQNGI